MKMTRAQHVGAILILFFIIGGALTYMLTSIHDALAYAERFELACTAKGGELIQRRGEQQSKSGRILCARVQEL